MDIQKLTQDYKKRFFAYAERVAENPPKKGKKKSELESPNFLKEVIRPILSASVMGSFFLSSLLRMISLYTIWATSTPS